MMVSWHSQTLTFLQSRRIGDGQFEVKQIGVEAQGADDEPEFARRLAALGLKGCKVRVMLRPEQYQILQIPAPSVAPEEVRAAARFQIREMVDTHIDDLTLDVMRVGDDEVRSNPQMFVIAANNAVIRAQLELAAAMDWDLQVIDIQDTAQRNLQCARARQEGREDRATAMLSVFNDKQALLTVSAKDELFYTRRIDLGAGLLQAPWALGDAAASAVDDPFADVPEYVPGYAAAPAPMEDETSQRFIVEVQRSLDVWDRSWPNLPLQGLTVHAGQRSTEMATWLTRELGIAVTALHVDNMFTGFNEQPHDAREACLPLLGALLRVETRKL